MLAFYLLSVLFTTIFICSELYGQFQSERQYYNRGDGWKALKTLIKHVYWKDVVVGVARIIMSPLVVIAFAYADISWRLESKKRHHFHKRMLEWEQHTMATNGLNLTQWHALNPDTRYTMLRETISFLSTKDLTLIVSLEESFLDHVNISMQHSILDELADRQLLKKE